MEPQYTLRSRTHGIWLGGLAIIAAVIIVVSLIDTGMRGLGPTVLFSAGIVVLAYGLFKVPALQVNPTGLTVVDTLSITQVPWKAVKLIEARFGLKIVTTKGRTLSVRSFGSSGVRADIPWKIGSDLTVPIIRSGTLNQATNTRNTTNFLHEFQEAGLVDRRAKGPETVTRTWNVTGIGAVLAGAAAMAGGIALL